MLNHSVHEATQNVAEKTLWLQIEREEQTTLLEYDHSGLEINRTMSLNHVRCCRYVKVSPHQVSVDDSLVNAAQTSRASSLGKGDFRAWLELLIWLES